MAFSRSDISRLLHFSLPVSHEISRCPYAIVYILSHLRLSFGRERTEFCCRDVFGHILSFAVGGMRVTFSGTSVAVFGFIPSLGEPRLDLLGWRESQDYHGR